MDDRYIGLNEADHLKLAHPKNWVRSGFAHV